MNLKKEELPDGSVRIVWHGCSGIQAQIGPPVLSVSAGSSRQPVLMRCVSRTAEHGKAVIESEADGDEISGTCRIEHRLRQEGEQGLLVCTTHIQFAQPVKKDITALLPISVQGLPAEAAVLPERTGTVRTYEPDREPEACFNLDRAGSRKGIELALPGIGVDFKTGSFAVSADPYTDTDFRVQPVTESGEQQTRIFLCSEYPGSTVPVFSAERTIALQFHQNGIDGHLRNFYHTIPDIRPGPLWMHDIHLTFYDYIADRGTSLKPDLEALASRIPQEFRKHVLVCLHGYYDYLGRYSYSHGNGTFDRQWDAYDNRGQHLPMTTEELHRRVRLIKSFGFRAALYFADALAYDDLNPEFSRDRIWRDADGEPVRWYYWQNRPDKQNREKNYMLDPSNPEVRQWFTGYAAACVNEFGEEVDALVWDETNCVSHAQVCMTPDGPASAGRAMMRLVADVTKEIENGWCRNPDLALLVSDNIYTKGAGHIPFCLVAHGTWQDSHCNPDAWAPGMIPNYRNCLYSCNWRPVGNRSWNRIAAEKYGLPQGLSNGFGDDIGPSHMEEDLLNETVSLFLKQCADGRDRTRYLLPAAPE